MAGDNLFQSLWPSMMQRTRLLIIDHDVCSYHSFGLLKYQLYVDCIARTDAARYHFASMKPEYDLLLASKAPLMDQVHFMRERVVEWNPYDCFRDESYQINSIPAYEKKLNEMFHNMKYQYIPTDISTHMRAVIQRDDMTGYLVRYKNDPCMPGIADVCESVIDADSVFDMELLSKLIIDKQINAIMIASVEIAVQIIEAVVGKGYRSPMTVMLGQYAYNFTPGHEVYNQVPKNVEEITALEEILRYEFGYFDPFTGITHMKQLERQLNQLEEDKNGTDGSV